MTATLTCKLTTSPKKAKKKGRAPAPLTPSPMDTPITNYGQDEAFRLIIHLQKNVFPKMTQEEIESFREDIAYYLDIKTL